MPLTKQQLLIPRVLCIGTEDGKQNYPKSLFKSGQVLELDNISHDGRNCYVVPSYDIDYFLSYPNCFNPLPWWYGRNVEEMPLYLIFIDDGKTEFVLKVEKYLFHKDTTEYWAFEYLWENEPDLKRMALTGWQPADESDYQEYQKQKEA